ncbi:MAG TPA: ion channel [Actinomycetes bacterium]
MSGTPVPVRPSAWVLVWALARVVLTAVVVLGTYFVVPFHHGRFSDWLAVFVGLSLITVVVIVEARRIARSDRPFLQAGEALTLSALLFLTLFAGVYGSMQANQPGAFNAPLTKIDSLYFSVTVLATVGFGDIVPVKESARALVTVQMVGDLVFIGVALRVLLGVTRRAMARREAGRE